MMKMMRKMTPTGNSMTRIMREWSLGKKISYVVCNIKWEFLSAGCY